MVTYLVWRTPPWVSPQRRSVCNQLQHSENDDNSDNMIRNNIYNDNENNDSINKENENNDWC